MKQFILLLLILCFSLPTFASTRVEDCLNDDRAARLEEINRLVIKINQSESDLANFRFELGRIQSNSSKLSHDIFMRDASGALAAIGFFTTLIYQKKHITPNVFWLVGGYTLSTISAIVMAIENKGVRLSQKEIADLKQSIAKLERLIVAEKKNLEREIDLLNSTNH